MKKLDRLTEALWSQICDQVHRSEESDTWYCMPMSKDCPVQWVDSSPCQPIEVKLLNVSLTSLSVTQELWMRWVWRDGDKETKPDELPRPGKGAFSQFYICQTQRTTWPKESREICWSAISKRKGFPDTFPSCWQVTPSFPGEALFTGTLCPVPRRKCNSPPVLFLITKKNDSLMVFQQENNLFHLEVW